jgi:hypothetical protein
LQAECDTFEATKRLKRGERLGVQKFVELSRRECERVVVDLKVSFGARIWN